MKKALLLIAIIAIWVISVDCLAETSEDGFEYTIRDDGTCSITGWEGDVETLIIPDTIEGHPVTTIEGSFESGWYSNPTSIVLPNTVQHIEGNPFNQCGLLDSIIVSPENEYFEVINNVLFSKKENTLVWVPTDLDVDNY